MEQPQLIPEGLVVVGEATRSADPDVVEIIVNSQFINANSIQALRENAERTIQLAKALTALGVNNADINIIGLRVDPLYHPVAQQTTPGLAQATGAIHQQSVQPQGSGELQVIGHRVNSMMRVKLYGTARFEEIAATALMINPNINLNVFFRLRDESSLRRAALEEAGRDGRAKAEALVCALGMHLGDPVSVIEDTFWKLALGAFGDQAPVNSIGGVTGRFNNLSGLRNEDGLTMMSLTPGELNFVARVQITYGLGQGRC